VLAFKLIYKDLKNALMITIYVM